jgi:hypothetical protein
MLGVLSFTNISKSPCTLRGFFRIDLLDQNERVVVDQTRHGVSPALAGVTNEVRTVILGPGRPNQAEVPIQFFCQGAVPAVRTVRVELPNGTTLYAKSGADPWTVQSCSSGSGTSVLSEGPIQAKLK